MRITWHEREGTDRYLLQFSRADAEGRKNRRALRRLGGRVLREERGQTFRDPNSSFDSPITHLIQDYPIKSRNVFSHIRPVTHGKVCLEKMHPLRR
ncbi:MAG: hypothetical protein CMM74_05350 [Rhodospirillaceae bacterium]|nr:hypothetical protein [Rhodospirillaceae bacterium]